MARNHFKLRHELARDGFDSIHDIGVVLGLSDVKTEVPVLRLRVFVYGQRQLRLWPERFANPCTNAFQGRSQIGVMIEVLFDFVTMCDVDMEGGQASNEALAGVGTARPIDGAG